MGVVARILGKSESVTELRGQVENAKRALDESQLAWGDTGTDAAREAFLLARDEHDRLVGKLLAAEKRERDERERAAREQTARDEAQLAQLLSRIGEIGAYAHEVQAAAVENARERFDLASRLHKRIAERENDIHKAQQLASKLGRDLALPSVTTNNLINGVKEAIDHAALASKIDPIVTTTAIELAVPTWVHRGVRG